MVIQAVYRVHSLVIIVLGRFWRSIGLNSSGPAALSFPKEWKACFIRVSFIQGIPCKGIGGGVWYVWRIGGIIREMLISEGNESFLCVSCK